MLFRGIRKKRARERVVRYYIYLSDAKVSMLYEQMPMRVRDALAADLELKAPFVSASVSARPLPIETRSAQLGVVERWLDDSAQMGGLTDKKLYFRFSMPMEWGYLRSLPEKDDEGAARVAFFCSKSMARELDGGSLERQFLALGGSAHHIVGASVQGSINPRSMLPNLATALGDHAYLSEEVEGWVTSKDDPAVLSPGEGAAATPAFSRDVLDLAQAVRFPSHPRARGEGPPSVQEIGPDKTRSQIAFCL
jgi:hypothetical protein